MRRGAILAATLLAAACGSAASRDPERQAAKAEAEPVLECAVDGARDCGDGCTLERTAAPGGAILTIRSPTGSFRRLRVTGGRVAAADGAEPARILAEDARRVEVVVGGDRYSLPRQALR
ncbi:MAG: hypothetical protein QOH81_488 [Sphingomonadales bacterium]|jgi:hypothetical protein|nr:hypothetical protein [Sphingomonadales bacterium]